MKIFGNAKAEWLVLVFVLFLLYAPFIDKAFHMDDTTFIDFARMIDWNPLHAVPSDYAYKGRIISKFLPYEATHPLLIPYLLKAAISALGEREIPLHLVFLVFSIVSLLALKKINSVFFHADTGGTVLIFFMSAPAFVVNSHNLMTDVPTLSCVLLALVFYIQSVEKYPVLYLVAGSGSLLAAIFISYQALAFIPVIGLYAVLKKRLSSSFFVGLLIPFIVLIIWLAAVYSTHGVLPLLKSKIASSGIDLGSEIRRGFVPSIFWGKVASIFVNIGASMIFVVFFYHIMTRSIIRLLGGLVLLTIVFFLLLSNHITYAFHERLLLSIFLAFFLLSMEIVIRESLSNANRDDRLIIIFMLVWSASVILYNIILLPFGSARYLLPALPPLIMLCVNFALRASNAAARPYAAYVIMIISFLFGFASAGSDYSYANVYRHFSREVKIFALTKPRDADVWYIGEWGMRHYLQREGFRYLLSSSEQPKKGDYVITAEMPGIWNPSPGTVQRLRLYAERRYDLIIPLRLFNLRSHAGFYAHHWGLLPFSFSLAPQEVFYIWEVY
ncbi:MAG: glycosyltransferase family 39 protein [Nitrospirae bacterium]|nr:glycosyltransferase family 39 protein [Nitrospirota bacterium]